MFHCVFEQFFGVTIGLMPAQQMNHNPTITRVLCVDLDGTILATDSLWEAILAVLRRAPWELLLLPYLLLRGKAPFKRFIAERADLDVAALPFRDDVVEFIRGESQSGREVILVTGADTHIAEAVAKHLGLFTRVLASDGRTNLRGKSKLRAVRELIGGGGFDYIGDGAADIPVYEAATECMLVGPSPSLLRRVRQTARVRQTFGPETRKRWAILREMRIRQWSKNVLVFVPLLLAHLVTDLHRLLLCIVAFFSFSLVASGVYVVNDLLDLEADRKNPTKKLRPLASGALSVRTAMGVAPFLFAAGLGLAALLKPDYLYLVIAYIVIGFGYSLYLKRKIVADVMVLAGLYTLRIFAGGVAGDVLVSPWLMAFSVFMFLSLAFVKRYAEILRLPPGSEESPSRRGYRREDSEVFHTIGASCGCISVLVLALYVNTSEVTILYRRPQVLWLVCGLLLYWLTRTWFAAHRGDIEDDPLTFSLKDRTSYLVAIATILVLLAAM
jgi:4-hydroxybenzoate polyprenyltransferase/phosphoserine phosphatase